MSNIDEKIIERVRRLEREVERLKVHGAHKAGMYADTYFDDLQYQLVGQRVESPSSRITVSAAEGAMVMAKTCVYPDDYLTMTVQMSHRWKTGSAIYPHLHWWQTANTMPNLLIGYRWQYENKAKTTGWTNLAHSGNAFTWSTGTLNQITKFSSITPTTDAALSDCVQFRIYRDVGGASTDYSGKPENDGTTQDDVYAVSFDIHFELDSAGSDTEYGK